ncbi:MAG: glutamine amidotransferase [Planctomycetota bacterium]|nr:glutamine amidotransferase [Planctomycetota bacterium]
MLRFLEIILGLQKGFLSRDGHLTFQFNPSWPGQEMVGGASVWNLLLVLGILALVVHVYRREGRSRGVKLLLGCLRLALLLFTLMLLNRPVLTLGQIRREPSVLAVLVDDSISMKVKDVAGPDGKPRARLDAIIDLLAGRDAELLRKLSSVHTVRIYDFNRGKHQLASLNGPGDNVSDASKAVNEASVQTSADALRNLKPEGDGTQIVSSLRSVMEDLQGQRVAGVVLLTDGRETPTAALPDAIAAVKTFGINVYPIPVGSDRTPQNIAIQSVGFEPSAFVDDITDFKVTLQATGYEPNHPITLAVERETIQNGQKVRVPVKDEYGRDITQEVIALDGKPFQADIQFKPTAADMPSANLVVEAKPQEGELDDADNFRPVQLAVLDDNISLLYVDGYPRWDYRYLKTSMLRDKTVKISCLLTSADPNFRQEGSDDANRASKTWAITAFPTSMDQLMDYDAVIFGDVDPRQFTDAQLQMVSDFVSKKGGGFEMVAGPRWSPQSFRNTPIEPILPVIITHTQADDMRSAITAGFRPAVTKAGSESPIFRFFGDVETNDEFLKNHLQDIFWYCRGLLVKPGVGIVFAEHPTDLGPDNRKAPLLVAGRFGAGRTIFSAIDDSWRWRYYTGESIFNTYWVQQLRYLARGRKLGQRKLTFATDRDAYELGRQVSVQVRVLSPEILQNISPPINVEIDDDATGQPVRKLDLTRQEGSADVFSGTFTADKVGQFTVKLPHIISEDMNVSYKIETPRLELVQPQVDVAALSRLATDSPIPFVEAAARMVAIPSAAKIIPVDSSIPLWNAPLALVVFVLLITLEWVLRKMFGML